MDVITPDQVTELRRRSTRIRLRDLRMVYEAGLGHIGGEFSAIDILTTLYFGVLRHDPARPDDPGRDRFVLSKGHSAAALYVTLAEAGYFDPAELSTFQAPLSRLGGHPDRTKVPGVETTPGRRAMGYRSRSASRSPPSSTGRTGGRSCSRVTGSSRKDRCGRRRCPRVTSAWMG